MAEKKEPVDVPDKATPLGPQKPVEVPAVMGATFAERAAAREGKAVKADTTEDKSVKASRAKTSAK